MLSDRLGDRRLALGGDRRFHDPTPLLFYKRHTFPIAPSSRVVAEYILQELNLLSIRASDQYFSLQMILSQASGGNRHG
jgi:hypothetical protein